MQSLAVIYRPKKWSDVVEQGATKDILQSQLDSGNIKGAYCFVGAAGTGKTTCARIFANEINKGKGNPIEIDAASNNGVDDVREITKMAQTRSMDSEYKVFIIDECHLFSAGAWGAMLKLIEEPPAKCVFILCTTDYWKIPRTIQSRTQRFEFKRISTSGIMDRLSDVLATENISQPDSGMDAIEFIAKQADGCMRDGLTMLDKCLAYSEDLTFDNVVKALGLVSYEVFVKLTYAIFNNEDDKIIEIIENVYSDGVDIKQFVKQYMSFVLDTAKYRICGSFKYTQLPATKELESAITDWSTEDMLWLTDKLVHIDSSIKYSQAPKQYIEAQFLVG